MFKVAIKVDSVIIYGVKMMFYYHMLQYMSPPDSHYFWRQKSCMRAL